MATRIYEHEGDVATAFYRYINMVHILLVFGSVFMIAIVKSNLIAECIYHRMQIPYICAYKTHFFRAKLGGASYM